MTTSDYLRWFSELAVLGARRNSILRTMTSVHAAENESEPAPMKAAGMAS